MTMCEEIEGLLKINMNRVNDQMSDTAPKLQLDHTMAINNFNSTGQRRQAMGNFS